MWSYVSSFFTSGRNGAPSSAGIKNAEKYLTTELGGQPARVGIDGWESLSGFTQSSKPEQKKLPARVGIEGWEGEGFLTNFAGNNLDLLWKISEKGRKEAVDSIVKNSTGLEKEEIESSEESEEESEDESDYESDYESEDESDYESGDESNNESDNESESSENTPQAKVVFLAQDKTALPINKNEISAEAILKTKEILYEGNFYRARVARVDSGIQIESVLTIFLNLEEDFILFSSPSRNPAETLLRHTNFIKDFARDFGYEEAHVQEDPAKNPVENYLSRLRLFLESGNVSPLQKEGFELDFYINQEEKQVLAQLTAASAQMEGEIKGKLSLLLAQKINYTGEDSVRSLLVAALEREEYRADLRSFVGGFFGRDFVNLLDSSLVLSLELD